MTFADAGAGDDPIIGGVKNTFQITIRQDTLRYVAAPTDDLCIVSHDDQFSLWLCILCRRICSLGPTAHDNTCIVTAKAKGV